MKMQLLCGDVRELLATLPAESVQTVVTSPPYFRLRDYGTASWDGGDPECHHRVGNQVEDNKARGAITAGVRPGVDASRCIVCGARRIDRQLGLEATPAEFVAALVIVFRELRRVLRPDGTVWLNLGDSYAGNGKGAWNRTDIQKEVYVPGMTGQKIKSKTPGLKPKDLIGIPWRVAFALQDDGWWLRSDIVWDKPNAMPESITDRPTRSHEYLFLLTKRAKYHYDHEAVREPARLTGGGIIATPDKAARAKQSTNGTGATTLRSKASPLRNRRTVWSISTQPYKGAHFAVFPEKLIEPCVLAGSRPGDVVLDPFCGSGTAGVVALRHGRDFIGIDLNAGYLELAYQRIAQAAAKEGWAFEE